MEQAKLNLDSFALELELKSSISLERDKEFFLPMEGVVIAERIDDSEDSPRVIRLGEVRLHLLKVADALNEFGSPEALFDVADGTSSELGGVVWDVVCGGEDSEVYDLGFGCSNLLLIERIKIAPEHRQLGIGKRVVKAICRTFSYCDFIALKPFAIELPIHDQDESEKMCARKEAAFRAGAERLTRFYQRFGFRLIFGEHMTFSPQLLKQPTLREAKRARAALAKRAATVLQ